MGSTYKIEIEKERNELDERLDEKTEQLKEMTKNYTEAVEKCKRTEAELDRLKAAQPTENHGESEELNILHNRCSELELELKSKNSQMVAQDTDLKSKEATIAKLEVIKTKRSKEAIATGQMRKRYEEEKEELQKVNEGQQMEKDKLQKEKDELQKDFLEKDEECMKLYISLTDKIQICAELTRTMEEFKEDIKRLQRLVQEKDDALGEKESMDENTKQKVLSQTSELESKKEECAKEKEAKERLSAELETKKEECTKIKK